MITGDHTLINTTLENLTREQNIRLFKTISKSYAFYADMIKNPTQSDFIQTIEGHQANTDYWFKINNYQKVSGWYSISDKLIINIMGTRSQADPSHPAITHSIDYEINYIQREDEVRAWLNEYTNIVRELKLNTLL